MCLLAPKKHQGLTNISWLRGTLNQVRTKSSKNTLPRKKKVLFDFYEDYVGSEWMNIYKGLIQIPQCCAVLNKYNNQKEQVKNLLETKRAKIPKLCIETENNLLCYKMKDSSFSPPSLNNVGASNYYLMDASSLLPVLALKIESYHYVLDLCAAPGGKSYAILQLLSSSGTLVANEANSNRRKRLQKVISECVPSSLKAPKIHISGFDGVKMGHMEKNLYDRVLVDVPCSAERHIILDHFANSSWSLSKSKRYSTLQLELLKAGLSAVMPGGVVVYSTCSLSPYENDGVIERVMSSDLACGGSAEIRDLSEWVNLEEFVTFKNTKFGILIFPTVAKNWGPLYPCKLQKRLI